MKAIFKLIKIVLAALLILITVALIGLVIFVKTFDANKYKPQIIAAAKQALGRPIEIKDISLSLSWKEGLRLQLNGLAIGDDPAFSKADFFTLPQIDASVDVLTFIRERRIAVNSIVLNAPKVVVIRDSAGRLNVQTIGAKPAASAAPAQSTASAPAPVLPPIIIKSFKVEDATIIFEDNTFAPALKCAVEHMDLSVKDFSLDKPFDAALNLALFADKANVQASSRVVLNLSAQEAKLSDAKATIDLSLFSMAKLAVLPMVKKEQLPETLSGKVKIAVMPLTVSAKGLNDLSAQITLADGAVKTAQLAQAVSSVNATLNLTDKDLTIDNFSAALAKGTISVKGSVKDYPAAKNIELELAVKDLELNDALEQSKAQIKVAGVMNFNFKAQGSVNDLKSIKGDGTLEIKPATLKDFNLLKTALDKITFLPGLSDQLISLLNEKDSQALKSPDTLINRVGLTIKVEQGAANVDPIAIEADQFGFTGKATVDSDQNYTLDGEVAVSETLSAQMAKGIKEIEYLYNEKKCIAIPVNVTGKGSEQPKVKVTKTFTAVAKNAAVNEGAEQLGKVIDKYLGASTSSGDSNSTSTGDAIKGLLNKFLSK